MAEKLTVKDGQYPLKLGKSMEAGGSAAFHSMRFDFKPASVDTSKPAKIDIGENNFVTVTVPHIEGSGTQETVYHGNRRPCQKECVLIIDHSTNEFTLEKLAYNMQLKSTRANKPKALPPANPEAGRPVTPAEKSKAQKNLATKKKVKLSEILNSPQTAAGNNDQVVTPLESSQNEPGNSLNGNTLSDDELSSSSNSSSDSSDDSSDDEPPAKVSRPAGGECPALNLLNTDLQLSDSGEDSS